MFRRAAADGSLGGGFAGKKSARTHPLRKL